MHCFANIFIALALLITACKSESVDPSAGSDAPDGYGIIDGDFSEWAEQYYKNPQPQYIFWFMRQLTEAEVLGDASAMGPAVAFLAHVFAANPDKIDALFPPENRVFEDDRQVFYSALWLANVPEAIALLTDVESKGSDELRASMQVALAREVTPVLELPPTHASILDMYWASFYATGNVAYIDNILAVLEGNPEEISGRELTVRSAAEWSLTSNAKKHEVVFQHCKRHINDGNAALQTTLAEIIADAAAFWEK